jgi:hypothetical protein
MADYKLTESTGDPGWDVVEDLGALQGYRSHFVSQSWQAFESLQWFSFRHAKALVEDGKVRCFADLLLAWLNYGDAALFCPTYEIYLKTVIRLIAAWNGEEDGVEMFVREAFFPKRAPDPNNPYWYFRGEPVLATIVRPGSEADLLSHPAFNRETYEVSRMSGDRTNWRADRATNPGSQKLFG